MAIRGKRKRLATQKEKDEARRRGEPVPTYVFVDTATGSYGGSYGDGGCSPSPSDGGGSAGSCDAGFSG